MTDAMLVAILGISGTVITSGLGAFFTYLNLKSQHTLKNNELRQQFEHESKEKQISRLIEKRALYLNLISEYLQAITQNTHILERQLLEIERISKSIDMVAWANSNSKDIIKILENVNNEISKYRNGVEVKRVQITDNRLSDLVNKAMTISSNVIHGIQEYFRLQKKHGDGDYEGNPNDEINANTANLRSLSSQLYSSIRECNFRIEEILSGKEEQTL
jgi:hypothetical protein